MIENDRISTPSIHKFGHFDVQFADLVCTDFIMSVKLYVDAVIHLNQNYIAEKVLRLLTERVSPAAHLGAGEIMGQNASWPPIDKLT